MEKTVDKIGEALLGDRLRHTYHYPARVHLFKEIKKAIREAVKETTMVNEGGVQMMKADDKVKFDESEPEEYTNFELLQKTVEKLKEEVMLIGMVLEQNDLTYKEQQIPCTNAVKFDDDVLRELEE